MTPQMDRTFFALGDPTRRAVLQRLTHGPATVGDLARPFSMSMQAVSKHLRVLEQAGLVRKTKAGRERLIALEVGPLREAGDWIGAYRQFWEGRLDSLAEVLNEAGLDGQEGQDDGAGDCKQ
ncbi:MAG: helix-turn-helix transcriptional regulator [Candidatus Hydrogenedentes bacterium]|nr:helix-turn-helix transcriptional regulator [Candidatus Hydrogenedentota bacterium]